MATLAIMGVLSVAGIAGFNSAMDKNKANTLMHEAGKRATIIMGQILAGNNPSILDFTDNTFSGGTFDTSVFQTGLSKQFAIKVNGVKKNVCQNILNTIGDKTPIRRLSYETTPTTPITTCKEEDDFLFVYNNDMTGENDTQYCESDESCGTCGVCSSTTHVCEGECTPPTNECDYDTDCNEKNECMICDTQMHKCKDGCERVQYLESTGSQYINTGVLPTQLTKAKLDLQFTNVNYKQAVLGSNDGSAKDAGWNDLFGTNENSSPNKPTVFWCQWGGSYDGPVTKDTNKHTHTFERTGNSSWTYTVDNSSTTITSGISTQRNPKVMYLFACNNNGTTYRQAKVRVYSCKIYDNDGTLVRDFVPVIAPNGKACMFNRVKEDGKLKLYCNSGSGDFKTNKD